MEKKFTDFSLEEANRFASSAAGKQLIDMMQSNPAAMQAAQSAQIGNMEQAKQALEGFMANPQAQALLRQLWEEYHG